jgi:DNA-binding transcriptional LysR family regulator
MKTLMGSRSPTPSAANWRWDDVRVLLVLARERKITSAARTLGVDAATITRRLQSLESALGITLFQRTGRGLRATEQLEALLPLFANVENSMRFAFAEAERFHSSEEGLVRLSAGPTLVEHWLIPSLPELHRRAPTILLELDCSAHLVDPQQREADIAVRLSKPRGSGLIARRIASLAMMLAVTPELARRLGAVDDWHAVPWIAGTGLDQRAHDEAFARAHAHRYALRASSLSAQIAAVRAGLGAVIMPSVLAERLALVPLPLEAPLQAEVDAIEDLPVWLVTRQTIRRAARIRLVWDWLTDSARELTGDAAE